MSDESVADAFEDPRALSVHSIRPLVLEHSSPFPTCRHHGRESKDHITAQTLRIEKLRGPWMPLTVGDVTLSR
jgi:hypothetical protein